MIDRWRGRARSLVGGLSVVWIVLVLVAFALRVTFPLELEWMEDGSLHQALRLRRGEAIYCEPTEEWIPYLYTPLYPAVLALASAVVPLGFVLGRVVSILSAIAIGVALWCLVAREGKPRSHRLLAVGLFCAGFVFSFRWLDVARADALFLALTIWALLLLRHAAASARAILLAGVLMALAFWTKQTAFVFILVSGLAGLLVAPRKLWIYVVTIAVIDGGGMLLGQHLTDGWLWTYIYELHQSHKFSAERLVDKSWRMFVHAAPFLTIALLGLVYDALRAWPSDSREPPGEEGPPARGMAPLRRFWRRVALGSGVVYWGAMCAAGFGVSALGYATQWAEPNAFLPGVCFAAGFFGVVMPTRGRWEPYALALVAAQMIFSLIWEPLYHPIKEGGLAALGESYVLQDPWRTVPHPRVRRRALALRHEIEGVEGGLLALQRPWWNVLAGGEGHVGSMGLHDVPKEARERVRDHVRREVREGVYEVLWFEGDPPRWIQRDIAHSYVVGRRLHGSKRVRPMVGYMADAGMVEPYGYDQLWLVKPVTRAPPPGATVLADFEGGRLQGFTSEGPAFGHRPIRSVNPTHAAVGPLGGSYMLSSGAREVGEEAEGSARSPVFELPAVGGAVELLAGYGGPRAGLRLEIVEEGSGRKAEIPLEKTYYSLRSHRWEVSEGWAGAKVRLVVVDESPLALIVIDDLWVVPAGASHGS